MNNIGHNVFKIQKLPHGWTTCFLDNAVKIVGGSQPPKKVFSEEKRDGYIRLIQIRDYKSDKYITYIPKNSTKKFCTKDDVMIGRYGPPVFQILRGLEGAYNVALMKAIPKENMDKDYLFYLLNSTPIQNLVIENSQRTAGQTGVNLKLLNKCIIPLPPLPQQKKIAAILDAADAYRQKTKALIGKYEELGQSLFLEMFGDPFKGEVFPLGDSIDLLGGYAFKSKDYVPEGIPLIKIGTVNKGYFDTSALFFLPYSFSDKYHKWIIKPGDLLMSLTGTVGKDDYGNVELATSEYDNYFLNQRVARINPIEEKYLPIFLFGLLSQKKTKNELTKISRGVRQANISNKDIQKLKLIRPPLEKQGIFVKAISKIYEQKAQAERSLEQAEALFGSLLQEVFAGGAGVAGD